MLVTRIISLLILFSWTNIFYYLFVKKQWWQDHGHCTTNQQHGIYIQNITHLNHFTINLSTY